jgi:hypothetical protein
MTWVLDGTWVPNDIDRSNHMSPGFGATISIINGEIECGHGTEKPQVVNRIIYYKKFSEELGSPIPENEQLGCAHSKGFAQGSSGATKTYLDADPSYNPKNPKGVSWACQLVTYETPFSVAVPGDYKQCVDYSFRGQVFHKGQLVIDNTKKEVSRPKAKPGT